MSSSGLLRHCTHIVCIHSHTGKHSYTGNKNKFLNLVIKSFFPYWDGDAKLGLLLYIMRELDKDEKPMPGYCTCGAEL